jgi:predicted O-linked N-acetylglucosamine transferase (SPINDLY family)
MVGYFDTTGLSTMDYRVTDGVMDPPGETERFHTERLVRMPHTCWCYRPDADAPPVAPPPALRNGFVTFGSLNKVAKISPSCAALWARVLAAVPRSRLLLSAPLGDPGGALRARLAELGLPPDRIDFAPRTPTRRAYLESFGRIDIALDTFPFNGITTTCDGLWMGVPHVTLAGGTSVSRAGTSILRAAGMHDLATATTDAFVHAAADLARDQDRLQALRADMRQRLTASPLRNEAAFTSSLENAYRKMCATPRATPPRGA